MSRFSNHTARALGYTAFAAAGVFGYMNYRPEMKPEGPSAPIRLVTAPELTASAAYATELSAVTALPRADDPIVNLAPLPHPAWELNRSVAELQRLERGRVEPMPRDYPSPQIRPMAIVRPARTQGQSPPAALPALAPDPSGRQSAAAVASGSWGGDPRLRGERPMVPLRGNSASPRSSSAAADPSALAANGGGGAVSWPDRGMVMLRDAGRSLLNGHSEPAPTAPTTTPPALVNLSPPSPAGGAGQVLAASSAAPAIDRSTPTFTGYTTARAAYAEPPAKQVPPRATMYIDQPTPGR